MQTFSDLKCIITQGWPSWGGGYRLPPLEPKNWPLPPLEPKNWPLPPPPPRIEPPSEARRLIFWVF